jgi:hypothetical protein
VDAKVTFKQYLAVRKAGLDAQGAFVRLALSDPAMPDITAWTELSAYIERRRGFQAVQAGRLVWAEYEAKQREMARRAKAEGA